MTSKIFLLSCFSLSFLYAADKENEPQPIELRTIEVTNEVENSQSILVLLPDCFVTTAEQSEFCDYDQRDKIDFGKTQQILVGSYTHVVVVPNPSPYYVFKSEGTEIELPCSVDSFVVRRKDGDILELTENNQVAIKGD